MGRLHGGGPKGVAWEVTMLTNCPTLFFRSPAL